jgi:MFS family permease
MGNFLFDNVKPAKRPQCVAVYHSANALGMFLGASLGGLLVLVLPHSLGLGGVQLNLVSNLQLLFLISAALRLAVSSKFLPLLRETREVAPFPAKELTARLWVVGRQTSVRMAGTLGRAVSIVILVFVRPQRRRNAK